MIADYDVAEAMLRHMMLQVQGRRLWVRPRAAVCIPYGTPDMERRALTESAESSGVREVVLVEQPVACALGAELPIDQARGHMVVDVGGGTTTVAVLSLGGVVHHHRLKVGGVHLDQAIAHHLRERHGLIVGARTAEDVKQTLGRAMAGGVHDQLEVRGRTVESGWPRAVLLSSDEVADALAEPVRMIIDAVLSALEHTPPDLASDVAEAGIVLAGGCAELAPPRPRAGRGDGLACHRAGRPQLHRRGRGGRDARRASFITRRGGLGSTRWWTRLWSRCPGGPRIQAAGSEQDLRDELVELRTVEGADVGRNLAATVEEHQGGHTSNAVLHGRPGVAVDVDLADLQLVSLLVGQGVDKGRDPLTGTAPGRREVQQDRRLAGQHFLVEIGVGHESDLVAGHETLLGGRGGDGGGRPRCGRRLYHVGSQQPPSKAWRCTGCRTRCPERGFVAGAPPPRGERSWSEPMSRVLLVSCDEEARRALRESFIALGYEVAAAEQLPAPAVIQAEVVVVGNDSACSQGRNAVRTLGAAGHAARVIWTGEGASSGLGLVFVELPDAVLVPPIGTASLGTTLSRMERHGRAIDPHVESLEGVDGPTEDFPLLRVLWVAHRTRASGRLELFLDDVERVLYLRDGSIIGGRGFPDLMGQPEVVGSPEDDVGQLISRAIAQGARPDTALEQACAALGRTIAATAGRTGGMVFFDPQAEAPANSFPLPTPIPRMLSQGLRAARPVARVQGFLARMQSDLLVTSADPSGPMGLSTVALRLWRAAQEPKPLGALIGDDDEAWLAADLLLQLGLARLESSTPVSAQPSEGVLLGEDADDIIDDTDDPDSSNATAEVLAVGAEDVAKGHGRSRNTAAGFADRGRGRCRVRGIADPARRSTTYGRRGRCDRPGHRHE